jgi:4-hydroxymandelate oxidase
MNPILNLDEYEKAARDRLEGSIYDYVAGGALDEITLRENRSAYERWRFLPRAMVGVEHRDLTVSILGDDLTFPVGISPSAFHQLVHPDGELATARAAGALGTVMCLSTMATVTLEDVAALASGPLWFQMYIFRDRGLTANLAARARAAGYRALVLTVDTPVLGRRERDFRNRFELPTGIEMRNVKLPEAAPGSYASPMVRFVQDQIDSSLTWKDVREFTRSVELPVLVKGILHPDDAHMAAEAGAAGIIVSNHGGRQLDGAIATLDALPPIASALSDTALDLIVDGGIRRGSDVIKALCLGAKMVMVGRPILWGLAVDGEAGAQAVLEILRREIDETLALLGCARARDLKPYYLTRIDRQDALNNTL